MQNIKSYILCPYLQIVFFFFFSNAITQRLIETTSYSVYGIAHIIAQGQK